MKITANLIMNVAGRNVEYEQTFSRVTRFDLLDATKDWAWSHIHDHRNAITGWCLTLTSENYHKSVSHTR